MTETAPPAAGPEAAPSDSPKRQQILDGARRMFLAKGFEGASMQDVAKAAGVSKGTLYVYFDSKEAVFEALVLKECGRMQDTVRRLGSGAGQAGDELCAIARQMVSTLLQPEVLAAMRMMIGAGEKFPDLARKIYEAGPARSAAILADYLQGRVDRGDLAIQDCGAAAAEFLDLVIAGLQRRALLMMPPLPDDRIEAHVTSRVGRFLAVYAPSDALQEAARLPRP
ncbi:TetR/AcrR family transcriptional regulator [Paracoccus yeei]|uniref:TetR/AcrR family transcriptional regulator n=1 Tax=Paracoccus yeei TaxID=147645 RepID=UPI0028D7CCF4|nr:TetR/AcrR family transcriptional regulator [Paracoccus yeei]